MKPTRALACVIAAIVLAACAFLVAAQDPPAPQTPPSSSTPQQKSEKHPPHDRTQVHASAMFALLLPGSSSSGLFDAAAGSLR